MNVFGSLLCASATLAVFTTAAAASDCTLRVTTWGGSYQKTYEKVAAEFEKDQNCKVEWVVGSSPDHLVKARFGQVDVATNTLLNSIAGEKEGLWQPLDKALIPNMANLYPNAIYSDQTIFVNIGDYVLAYNSEKVKDAPKSWNDLWNPDFKGKAIIYGFEHIPTLSLAVLQANQIGGSIGNMEPGLKRMADLYKGGNLVGALDVESQMVSLMQTGDATIGMLASGRVKELWQKGMKGTVKIVRPPEGTFPLISSMNVTKAAKDQKMAMTFVNYVLSKSWQEAFAINNTYAPTVKNATIPADFEYADLLVQNEAFLRLFLPDQDKIAQNKAAWRERLDQLSAH